MCRTTWRGAIAAIESEGVRLWWGDYEAVARSAEEADERCLVIWTLMARLETCRACIDGYRDPWK